MFIFNVDWAGHDKVSDAGRATTCRRKFRAPSLKQYVQKKEKGLPKLTFTVKPFEDFRQNKLQFLALSKQPPETHGPP